MDFLSRFQGKISHMTKDGIQGQQEDSQESKTNRNYLRNITKDTYNTNNHYNQKENYKNMMNHNQDSNQRVNSLPNSNQIDIIRDLKHKNNTQLNLENVGKQILCQTQYQTIKKNDKMNNTDKINYDYKCATDRSYTPYTIEDYRHIRQNVGCKSQGLGPALPLDQLIKKQQINQKINKYSSNVKQFNSQKKYRAIIQEKNLSKYEIQKQYSQNIQQYIKYNDKFKENNFDQEQIDKILSQY